MKTRTRPSGPRRPHPGSRSLVSALGYANVPSSGARSELRSQRAEIEQACQSLGLRLVDVVPEGRSPNGDPAGRPGLESALERLEAGEVSCLVVCGLEHLSRRVDELASVIDRMERAGVRLVALDVGLDTASSTGRLALERRPVGRAGQSVSASGLVDRLSEEVAPAEPPGEPIGELTADQVVEETPAVEAVEAAEEAPPVEAAEETPPVEAVAETPPVEAADETPPVEAAAETPPVEAADETPPVEVAAETPAVEAAEEAPPVEAADETPPVEAAAETPAVEAAEEAPPVEAAEEAPPVKSVEEAPATVATRALGYATLPSAVGGEQHQLQAQVRSIQDRCADLSIDLVDIVREREVEGRALDRPGLSLLIDRIAAGDANCLVVAALGRLSHSVAELGTIVKWLERNEIRLIAVDLNLDTASSGGRLTARALASVASLERDRLSERTRKGLAAARDKRRASAEAAAGGSPNASWPQVSKRIAAMRADGMTLQAIADQLNAEGVPTPRGGAQWRPSSVQTAAGYKRRSRAKHTDDLPTVTRPPGGSAPENPR
jgi:DNA invertase Pin-like site-specific DNA recombinase